MPATSGKTTSGAFPFPVTALNGPLIRPHTARETDDPNRTIDAETTKLRRPSRRKTAKISAPVRAAIADATQDLVVCLLESYLTLKANPSDAEVHHLAKALGVSKESLEEVMYSMLSERINCDEDEVLLDDSSVIEPDFAKDEEILPDAEGEPIYSEDSDSALEKALAIATTPFDKDTTEDAPDPSSIVTPMTTDERLSSDGEPDPYSIEQIRQGAPTRL